MIDSTSGALELGNRSGAPAPLSHRERVLLALAGAVALFVHARFRLQGFGEQDAARLAADAIHWHFERVIYMAKVDYRLRASPLYIHSLKLGLDHGLPIRSLPRVMNGASVFFSSLCLVLLYLLFRRFSSRAVASAAAALFAFTPCFWLGSVYGMPTVPALTFWLLAALSFARATDQEAFRKRRFFGFLSLAVACTCIACALKADIILSSGVFLSILVLQRRVRVAFLAWASALCAFGIAFNLGYSQALAAPVAERVAERGTNSLAGFLANWNARFPFHWDSLLDHKNNAPITHASGTLLFALVIISIVYGLVSSRANAQTTLALVAWGLPPMLFWGLKIGNSARHNLPAFPPLLLLASAFIFALVRQQTERAWLFIALFSVVAQLDTSGANAVTPFVNLLKTTEAVEGSTSALHQRARAFMASANPRKAIIESDFLIDFTEFEVWAAAKAPSFRAHPQAIVDGADGQTRVYRVGSTRAARNLAQSLRNDGWDVFSNQYSLPP